MLVKILATMRLSNIGEKCHHRSKQYDGQQPVRNHLERSSWLKNSRALLCWESTRVDEARNANPTSSIADFQDEAVTSSAFALPTVIGCDCMGTWPTWRNC